MVSRTWLVPCETYAAAAAALPRAALRAFEMRPARVGVCSPTRSSGTTATPVSLTEPGSAPAPPTRSPVPAPVSSAVGIDAVCLRSCSDATTPAPSTEAASPAGTYALTASGTYAPARSASVGCVTVPVGRSSSASGCATPVSVTAPGSAPTPPTSSFVPTPVSSFEGRDVGWRRSCSDAETVAPPAAAAAGLCQIVPRTPLSGRLTQVRGSGLLDRVWDVCTGALGERGGRRRRVDQVLGHRHAGLERGAGERANATRGLTGLGAADLGRGVRRRVHGVVVGRIGGDGRALG
jgi:hypothetical protein